MYEYSYEVMEIIERVKFLEEKIKERKFLTKSKRNSQDIMVGKLSKVKKVLDEIKGNCEKG